VEVTAITSRSSNNRFAKINRDGTSNGIDKALYERPNGLEVAALLCKKLARKAEGFKLALY
jgi:hypothetical protein